VNAKSIEKIEEIIGYSFKNKDILKEALTHKSYTAEIKSEKYNERLEFLGDSVLGCIIADYVYSNRPDFEEGRLSKIKSNLVSRKNLYHWAKDIDLGKYLYLSRSEISTGGRVRESILSNAMEALIGAIYLDAGYIKTKEIVLDWAETQMVKIFDNDYKSVLQEYFHTVGPEHEKIFTIEVSLDEKILGKGKGKNKKSAEQYAAKNALENIKNE